MARLWGRVAVAAALAAGLGCGNESLGGRGPAGAGGSSLCSKTGVGSNCGTLSTGVGGDAGGGGDGASSGGSGFGGAVGAGGVGLEGAAGSSGGLGGSGEIGGSGGATQFCGQTDAAASTPSHPDILVVLDRSSSMSDDTTGMACTGGCGPSSKWSLLAASIDALVQQNRQVNWGLEFYPVDDACDVSGGAAVVVGSGAQPAIEEALGATQPAAGQAPTAAAIYGASAYLQSLIDSNPKYILLASDGLSGCGTEDSSPNVDAENAVASVAAAGIPTIVVGIAPASDTTSTAVLNQMAVSGGMAAQGLGQFYYTIADLEPSFPPLAAASPATSCTVALEYPVGEANLQVAVTGTTGSILIPQDPSDGWSYSDAGMTNVVLNGAWCVGLQNGDYTGVQIDYVCQPPLLISP